MKQKLLLLSAMGLCLLSGPSLSYAVEDPNQFNLSHIGMVGIVPDQTIRLNVRALKRTNVPPGPCFVTLGFTDAGGRVVGELVTRVLNPGLASYLDLSGGSVGTGTSDTFSRIELHPAVRVRSSADSLTPACIGVAASVEVFDITGRTSVLIEDPDQFTAGGSDI